MRAKPELPECLKVATGLRVPVFARETPPRAKIEALESYLLLGAFTQGELAEERLSLMVDLVPIEDEWSHLAGWEDLKQTRTEKGVMDAKRRLRPDLFDQLTSLRWMIARLQEEIDRLERESTKISRAYTFMTGS